VIEIMQVDSMLQNELSVKLKLIELGKPNCGKCNMIATFLITKWIKGSPTKDTIQILYYPNLIFGFPHSSIGNIRIFFLNKLEGYEFYVITDPRFGIKSMNIEKYEKFINEYLQLNTREERWKWILKLTIDIELSWEGAMHFEGRSINLKSWDKEFLSQGLGRMDFEKNNYIPLLEIVQQFGKSDFIIKSVLSGCQQLMKMQFMKGLI
jgi:hypothetical protein